ncbi:MAG: hypothetical protein ACR2KZ_16275 [Segetibacter sp.]
METMLIELTNQKAAKLLRKLEELRLIKVLKTNVDEKEKLSEKYAGKIPGDVADALQTYVTKSRNEWSRSI